MSPSLAAEDLPEVDLAPLVDYMIENGLRTLDVTLHLETTEAPASARRGGFEIRVLSEDSRDHGLNEGTKEVFAVFLSDGPLDGPELPRG